MALIDRHDQTWAISSAWPAFTRRLRRIAEAYGRPVEDCGQGAIRVAGLPVTALALRRPTRKGSAAERARREVIASRAPKEARP